MAGIYDTLAVAAAALTQAGNVRGCAGLCQHQLTLVVLLVSCGVEATHFQICTWALRGTWCEAALRLRTVVVGKRQEAHAWLLVCVSPIL